VNVRRLLSWVLWPLLISGGMAGVHLAVERGAPVVPALVCLQISMVLVVAVLERLMPEHESWNRAHADVGTDALHLLVSGFVLSAVFRTLIFAGVPSLDVWPTRWPLALQVLLALAVADLGSYVTHVIAHRWSLAWPMHAPHHSSKRLYWLNATRMHPLDMVTTLVASLVPLALLGAKPPALALFDAFALTHLLLQHSNIRLRAGALSHVIATAEFHRWHHSTVRDEGERNYASFLSLWDHVFGTFNMPGRRDPPEEVGLYDHGVMPDGWWAQFQYPFRAWARARTSRER
jgi:sterol desaturase/sphingolipid hydroxylase (fatty acid hydroxylase superfamily)